MIDIKSYHPDLQKRLWDMFVKHQELVKLTYHSCSIEGSTLTFEDVEESLKPDYLRQIEKVIVDYNNPFKTKLDELRANKEKVYALIRKQASDPETIAYYEQQAKELGDIDIEILED